MQKNVGHVYDVTVVKTIGAGAFVQFQDKTTGFLHISELQSGFVRKVDDVVKVGEVIEVKIKELNEKGPSVTRLNLPQKKDKTEVFEEQITEFLRNSGEKQKQISKSNMRKRNERFPRR